MNELIIAEHKTFDLTICDCMDGAVVQTAYRTLSITRYTDGSVLCECDGIVITEAEAISYGERAQLDGRMVETSHTDNRIGKKRGHAMHKALVRAGYRSEHYALASGVLGREVRHLRELIEEEAKRVWTALTGSVAA